MKISINGRMNTKPLKEIYKSLGLNARGLMQIYLDKTVAENLMKYVSLNSGTQAKSIPIASNYGSGKVIINVPYARFQAEGKVMVGVKSRRAWAMKYESKVVIGKNLKYHSGDRIRGKHPFERMKADKQEVILRQVANYSRRLG